MIQLIAFFSCLSLIWGAVPYERNIQELIVGGKPTPISEVPYQVAVTSGEFLYCGGSILSPKYILVSAACVFYVNAAAFNITAGSATIGDGVVVPAKTAFIHPKFTEESIDYDVAIIELTTPLNYTKNIQPIKLANAVPPDGTLVKVSGYGARFANINRPTTKGLPLYSVEVPIVNRQTCEKNFETLTPITPRMICAGEEGKGACFADLGSPLAYNGELLGVVIFENGCGRKNIPTIFTTVVDPEIRAFIQQYIPK